MKTFADTNHLVNLTKKGINHFKLRNISAQVIKLNALESQRADALRVIRINYFQLVSIEY